METRAVSLCWGGPVETRGREGVLGTAELSEGPQAQVEQRSELPTRDLCFPHKDSETHQEAGRRGRPQAGVLAAGQQGHRATREAKPVQLVVKRGVRS